MTQQIEKQHGKSNISKYTAIIILVLLPVVLALATNGVDIQSLPPTLTSGVFPIAFTLLSWGTAAKLIHDSRK